MPLGDEFNYSSIFQMGDLGKERELTWIQSQLLKVVKPGLEAQQADFRALDLMMY